MQRSLEGTLLEADVDEPVLPEASIKVEEAPSPQSIREKPAQSSSQSGKNSRPSPGDMRLQTIDELMLLVTDLDSRVNSEWLTQIKKYMENALCFASVYSLKGASHKHDLVKAAVSTLLNKIKENTEDLKLDELLLPLAQLRAALLEPRPLLMCLPSRGITINVDGESFTSKRLAQLISYPHDLGERGAKDFKQMLHNLAVKSNKLKHAAESSDEKSLRDIMETLQAYTNSRWVLSIFIEHVDSELKETCGEKLKEIFANFLSGLRTLLKGRPEAIETSWLAQVLYHCFGLWFASQKTRQVIEIEFVRDSSKTVEHLLQKLGDIKHAPVNMLYFKLSVVEKGLRCLNQRTEDGVAILGKLAVGAVQLGMTLNPHKLIAACVEGAFYGARLYFDKQGGVLFNTLYSIELFRAYIFNKLLQNPKKTRSIEEDLLAFQEKVIKVSEQWEIGYAWVAFLSELMGHDLRLLTREEKSIYEQPIATRGPSKLDSMVEYFWAIPYEESHIVSQIFPGLLPRHSVAQSCKLKETLRGQKGGADIAALQEFILNGTDSFVGLSAYAALGTPSQGVLKSTLSQTGLDIVRGLESGGGVGDIMNRLNPLERLLQYMRFGFDAEMERVLGELSIIFEGVDTAFTTEFVRSTFNELKEAVQRVHKDFIGQKGTMKRLLTRKYSEIKSRADQHVDEMLLGKVTSYTEKLAGTFCEKDEYLERSIKVLEAILAPLKDKHSFDSIVKKLDKIITTLENYKKTLKSLNTEVMIIATFLQLEINQLKKHFNEALYEACQIMMLCLEQDEIEDESQRFKIFYEQCSQLDQNGECSKAYDSRKDQVVRDFKNEITKIFNDLIVYEIRDEKLRRVKQSATVVEKAVVNVMSIQAAQIAAKQAIKAAEEVLEAVTEVVDVALTEAGLSIIGALSSTDNQVFNNIKRAQGKALTVAKQAIDAALKIQDTDTDTAQAAVEASDEAQKVVNKDVSDVVQQLISIIGSKADVAQEDINAKKAKVQAAAQEAQSVAFDAGEAARLALQKVKNALNASGQIPEAEAEVEAEVEDENTANTTEPFSRILVQCEQRLVDEKKHILKEFDDLNHLCLNKVEAAYAGQLYRTITDGLHPELTQLNRALTKNLASATGNIMAKAGVSLSSALTPAYKVMEEVRAVLPQGAKQMFFDVLHRAFSADVWRVRERLLIGLCQLLENKELDEKVRLEIGRVLLDRRVKETDSRVKLSMDHYQSPEGSLIKAMRANWEPEKDKTQSEIQEKLTGLTKYQQLTLAEKDPDTKKKMALICEVMQQELDDQMTNLTNMERQMGIVILFLSDIKNQLFQIQTTLAAIQRDVRDIKADVKLMVGRNLPELLKSCARHKLSDQNRGEKIHIPLKGMVVDPNNKVQDDPNVQGKDLMAIVWSFIDGRICLEEGIFKELMLKNPGMSDEAINRIWQTLSVGESGQLQKNICHFDNVITLKERLQTALNEEIRLEDQLIQLVEKIVQAINPESMHGKMTLLLSGQSGSGKSSFMHYLETKLWEEYTVRTKGDDEDTKPFVIPIQCSLPALKNPLTNLVSETLIHHYGFNPYRVNELRVELGKAKPRYRLVIMADGYDELPPRYQFKEICRLNKLEQWGYPQFIATCRSEFLERNPGYMKYFYPTDRASAAVKSEGYCEVGLSDFSDQIADYLNARYKFQWKKHVFGHNVSNKEEALWKKMQDAFLLLVPQGEEMLLCINDRKRNQRSLDRFIGDNPEASSCSANLSKLLIPDKRSETDLWDPKKLRDSMKGMERLLTTPMMLTIMAEVLPKLSRGNTETQEQRPHTKYGLYEGFVQHLFEQALKRLQSQEDADITPPNIFKHDLKAYCQGLALAMAQKGLAFVKCTTGGVKFREISEWDTYFDMQTRGTKALYDGAPVRALGESQSYGFTHKTLQEFFVAQKVYEMVMRHTCLQEKILLRELIVLLNANEGALIEQGTVEAVILAKCAKFSAMIWTEIRKKREAIDIPLNKVRLFLTEIANTISQLEKWNVTVTALDNEPAICSEFLGPEITGNELFKTGLFGIVELSKLTKHLNSAAATAITVLNRAKVAFSGRDLSRIQVRGANLTDAIFDHADLNGANLGQTIMSRTNLNYSNLSGATMDGTQFGEYPYLLGHNNRVTCVAYHPNGMTFATGSNDMTVKLWEAATKKALKTLRGHRGTVWSVAFSPDEKVLASGSKDKTIILWDVMTRKLLWILEEHTDMVRSVFFNPNGDLLASGSDDKTVKVWNVATRETQQTCSEHNGIVMSVTFSPDGKLLGSGSSDNNAGLWDFNIQNFRKLPGHSNSVESVNFSPDGLVLASGSADKTIKLWNVRMGRLLETLTGHSDIVYSVDFSPTGVVLASGSADKTVKLWDLESKEEVQSLSGHNDCICSVSYSPDGLVLASGSDDNTTRFWAVETERSFKIQSGHTHSVISLSFHPNSKMLASGSWDNTIMIWDIQARQQLMILKGHSKGVRSVTFSPNGEILASGSEDKTIKLWNIRTGQAFKTLTGHKEPVYCVDFNLNGMVLASGSQDETIKLWNIETGETINTLSGHECWVTSVKFHPNLKMLDRLISGSWDKTIKLWNVTTGEIINTMSGHEGWVWSVAYSPDGTVLGSGSHDNTVRLWNSITGEAPKILIWHKNPVFKVTFSPDGSVLGSGSEDKTTILWSVVTGRILKILRGHRNWVWGVIFSPDGVVLATGSRDMSIKVWRKKEACSDETWLVNSELAREQTPFLCYGARINSAVFDSDTSKQLMSQGAAVDQMPVAAVIKTQLTFRARHPLLMPGQQGPVLDAPQV